MDRSLTMGMQPANHKRLFECDACLYEVSGYSRKDLEADGWVFHKINVTKDFVLCDECTTRYTELWDAKAAA